MHVEVRVGAFLRLSFRDPAVLLPAEPSHQPISFIIYWVSSKRQSQSPSLYVFVVNEQGTISITVSSQSSEITHHTDSPCTGSPPHYTPARQAPLSDEKTSGSRRLNGRGR